ncbi:MAG: hypothetical protein U0234_22010 [Sandaracinus sp.]
MANDDPGKQTSLADDEKAIGGGGGTGTMVAAVIVFGVLAIGIAVFVLRGNGESEYSSLGRQLNGMRQGNFDQFWGCVLPREDIRSLTGNAAVQAAVLQRAQSSPSAYATLVNGCMHFLDEHTPLLAQLIVPEDMRASVDQLRTALEAEIAAWHAFVAYLGQLGGPYDADDEQAQTLLTAVVRGWYDYRVAIGAVNDVISSHVHPE